MCVYVYVYIYMCVCVYVCMYVCIDNIYIYNILHVIYIYIQYIKYNIHII